MLKINTLHTFWSPFLGCRLGLRGLFTLLICLFCLGFWGCGSAREDRACGFEGVECPDSAVFLPNEAAEMFRLGTQCGVNVAEVRSVVGRDTLVKRIYIREPFTRVAALSSSQVGFMARLGLANRIVAVGESRFVVDSAVRENAVEVGNGPALNLEKLVALEPQLVLSFATGGGQDDYERLNSLGIPLLLTSEWQEESPLGKAEWIKLFAKLFCPDSICSARAGDVFAMESNAYRALSGAYNGAASGAVPGSVDARPRVMAGMSYGGVWYAPGGQSYTARLIAAAGGRYVWAGDSSREIVLPLESVLALADSADVWVNPGMFSTPEEILAADPRAASLRAFKQKRVCQNDGVMSLGGGNDFYEGAAPRPAELLLNLHGCLYPDSAAFPESAKAAPESADASIRGYLEAFSGNPAYKWYRNIYNSLHYE